MTALAGVWRLDGRPDAAAGCQRILAAQKIYGSDASAQWPDGSIALGRNLMCVLPEDKFDRQPIVGEGGNVLVAHVRLDNRDELTGILQIPPTQARQLSDAAILFAAIERWGEDCFDHIVGDYAFAFWNGANRSLMLARDPIGDRPLHYHRGRNFFAFASMPKGLHALPEIPYAPDEERMAEFLVLMPAHGSRTFFAGIERVEPGHVVTVKAEGLSSRRYWNPRRRHIKLKDADEYAQALRAHLDEAVRCRLRGAGDVGVFLSGGLDSGAVAATAARLLAPTDRRVIAVTAVPREGYNGAAPRNRFIDEGPHAAAVAALYPNIEHILIRNGERSLLPELDTAFYLNEQPLLNPDSAGWGTSISEEMKARNVKIALTGSFGNYGLSYDGVELLPELIRSGRWLHWLKEARALTRRGPIRWRGILAQTFGPWCPPRLWVWLNRIASGYTAEIGDYSAINLQRLAEFDLAARARERGLDFDYRPRKDSFAERLWCIQRVDSGNPYMGGLASTGLDFRHPAADIRLLEFCLAVPPEQFLRDGVRRALARHALADRLPKVVVDEKRIGLQTADWHEHLSAERGNIAAEIARLDGCPSAANVLDLPRLHRLMDQWPKDGWEREDVVDSYGLALIRAVSAGHFLRRASGSNA